MALTSIHYCVRGPKHTINLHNHQTTANIGVAYPDYQCHAMSRDRKHHGRLSSTRQNNNTMYKKLNHYPICRLCVQIKYYNIVSIFYIPTIYKSIISNIIDITRLNPIINKVYWSSPHITY